MQEAFLSALRGIGTLDRPAGFKPWLYRIAHNACIDQMRRRARAEEVSFDANAIPPAEEIRLYRHVPSNHAQVAQKEEFRTCARPSRTCPPRRPRSSCCGSWRGCRTTRSRCG